MENKLQSLEFEKPLHELERQLKSLNDLSHESKVNVDSEIAAIEAKIVATKREIFHNVTPWQRIQIARHPQRPYSLDYIEQIFADFQELHGDRLYGDDAAIIGGTASFNGQPVMVIGQQKGRDTKENIKRYFGCPHPEGYRKALRLMRLAEKFDLPIICFIDTPGAYPGIGAEERHVAEAIAVNIREMSQLTVPIICTVIGEGGSGGALGIAVADTILILENAYYSVISPEGCAAILWKDRKYAPDAAAALKIDSQNLKKLGVVDEILEEPLGGAHQNIEETTKTVSEAIAKQLKILENKKVEDLLEARYQKFRNMGVFEG